MNRKNVEAIIQNTKNLEQQLGVLAASIEIFNTTSTSTYTTRDSQITAVRKKYQGIADNGNALLQRLINLRVAFSVPNRLFLTKNSNIKATEQEVKDTKEFLNNFMALNNLDGKLPRDLAIEAELQGQVAIQIVWDPKAKFPRLKYYPWKSVGYTIKPTTQYLINSRLIFTGTINAIEKKFQDEEFVFIAFNDELNANIGYPTCGGILIEIENITKDIDDWRKLNHLFAHPTPHFKCETQEEADAINARITAKGWKVGTAIASNADFQLKGPTGAEGNLLMLSIQTCAKIISGHTGLGIHFLGFPNVMSNRATAESIGEPTEVVLHSEITSWHTFYAEMFRKAINIRNKKLNKALRNNIVLPKIVPITDRQWKTIEKIFMPILDKGWISHETFLDKLPDIDTDSELERIKEEDAKSKEKKPEKESEEEIEEVILPDGTKAYRKKENNNPVIPA